MCWWCFPPVSGGEALCKLEVEEGIERVDEQGKVVLRGGFSWVFSSFDLYVSPPLCGDRQGAGRRIKEDLYYSVFAPPCVTMVE